MKYAARLAIILIAGFWALTAPQPAAGQGGHGGGGGHGFGGHSGGHSSHGSFSGHASGHATGNGVGHSISHSVARFFGWHGKSTGSQPRADNAALVEQKMGPQPNPSIIFPPMSRPLRRRQEEPFIFGHPLVLHRRGFGFGGCPAFGFSVNNFFFGNRFDCFDSRSFFFDPFFFGFSSSSWYGSPAWSRIGPMETPLSASLGQSDSVDTNSSNAGIRNQVEDNANREPPVTLLQLRNGSIYGLTEYWVEGDQLHYFTTYGTKGSVSIQRIDFGETAKLNAGSGVRFVLRLEAAPPR
jgi:hypothetical protein